MWPSTLSGRLPVDALVGHYPTNKLIGRELILYQKIFPPPHTKGWSYPVLDPVSQAYPEVQGRSLTCYSPVRHSSTPASWGLSVRLACVKHAASVRPEPGSNSPQKISSIRTRPYLIKSPTPDKNNWSSIKKHIWLASDEEKPNQTQFCTQKKSMPMTTQ